MRQARPLRLIYESFEASFGSATTKPRRERKGCIMCLRQSTRSKSKTRTASTTPSVGVRRAVVLQVSEVPQVAANSDMIGELSHHAGAGVHASFGVAECT